MFFYQLLVYYFLLSYDIDSLWQLCVVVDATTGKVVDGIVVRSRRHVDVLDT